MDVESGRRCPTLGSSQFRAGQPATGEVRPQQTDFPEGWSQWDGTQRWHLRHSSRDLGCFFSSEKMNLKVDTEAVYCSLKGSVVTEMRPRGEEFQERVTEERQGCPITQQTGVLAGTPVHGRCEPSQGDMCLGGCGRYTSAPRGRLPESFQL